MNLDMLASFATLTAMEIVLGIDNIVFLEILVGRLPVAKQAAIRRIGLGLALAMRILLLLSISWVMGLKEPLFALMGKGFSGRDLILAGGGLFLIWKATSEIHAKIEGGGHGSHELPGKPKGKVNARAILAQIVVIDIVFSLDSVITAVGMVEQVWIMVAAMVVAVGVMLFSAARIGGFVERHPTVKVLALSFLLMIGVMLLAEGMGLHVPKGYIYFAMAFSLGVEMVNIRAVRSARKG